MNTSLSKVFDTALSDIVAAQGELLTRANAERKEMLSLVARMSATRNEIRDLQILCNEFVEELTGLGADCGELADMISDTLDEPLDFCPTCDYQDLVGYCDECGCEIVGDSTYSYDEATGTLLCGNCMPETDAIAESVAGA